MKSSEKHVLVTGGTDFVGSHLCERLLAEGRDVLCVDNFYTGSKEIYCSSFPESTIFRILQ